MAIDFFRDEPQFENGKPVEDKSGYVSPKKEVFEANHAHEEAPDFFNKDIKAETETESESEVEAINEEDVEEVVKALAELPVEEENKVDIDKDVNKGKFILGKAGDSNLELLPTTKFSHKVAGEEREITLQELLNDYSGREGWQQKFTELDKDRQAYKKELDVVNKYIGEFASKTKTDPIAAFEYLAEISGVNPLEFRRNLRKTFNEKFSEYQNMSEDQRQVYELKEENEFFKREKEVVSRKQAEEQAAKEFQSSILDVQKTHDISDERLDSLAQDLRQHGGDKEVTLENVVQLHKAYVIQDRVFDTLTKVNPEFIGDDEKFNSLESLLKGNPSMDDKQLVEYANKLWNAPEKKAVENLKKKVGTKKPAIETKIEQNYKPKLNSSGSIDFF